MDEKTGSANIAELFSEKYCELYNSVSYEHEQLAIISDANTIDIGYEPAGLTVHPPPPE